MINSIQKNVKCSHDFEGDISYVLCTNYGSEGLIPTLTDCEAACISSSGDAICMGYKGHEKIPNTDLSIVCLNTQT